MFYQFHPIAASDYISKEQNENFSYPTHMHQSFELVIATSGEMHLSIDGDKYSIKEKSAALIFPNRLHSFDSSESSHILFIFSPKIVSSFYSKYTNKIPTCYSFPLDDFIFEELKALTPESSIAEIKGLLYLVCSRFEKSTAFIDAQTDKEELLMKIFSFVENNYRAECTLYNASRAIGYDNAYISRYFKRMTGISYNSYVNLNRLSYASYLLKNTSLSILECSIDSGFKSLRSFNRNFKEHFKKTPQEYRE